MQGSGEYRHIAVGACSDARLGRARANGRGACTDARIGRVLAYGELVTTGVWPWGLHGCKALGELDRPLGEIRQLILREMR